MPLRSLVEGAVLAALAAVLALLGVFLGPLGLIFNLIWTMPIVAAVSRHGLQPGILALVTALLIVALFAGLPYALTAALLYGPMALFLGWAFYRQKGAGRTFLVAGTLATLSTVLTMYLFLTLTGISLGEIEEQIRGTFPAVMDTYRQLGILDLFARQGVSEAQLQDQYNRMITVFKLLLPGILVLTGSFLAALNYLLARVILKRVGQPVPPMTPFREWQLPWYYIWGFILGLILNLWGNHLYPGLEAVGQNILWIYFPVVVVIGAAVAAAFMQRWDFNPLIKVGLLILSLLYLQFVILFLASIGLFDLVFNYRKILPPKAENGNNGGAEG